MLRHRRSVFCASLLCVILLAASAIAARNYERLSFDFTQPVQMKITSNGTKLVLQFSQPVNESREEILGKAGPHASDVSFADGNKQVTITLDAAYRTRQFTSGNKLGLDILTGDAVETAVKNVAPSASGGTPAEKPVEVVTSAAIMTTKPMPQPTAEPLLTTKKPEEAPTPAAAIATPEPPKEPTPPTPPSVMTTKEESPAPPPPAPEPATAAPAKPEAVAAPENPAPETSKTETPPAPPAAEQPPAGTPFMVTTKDTDGGIWINFPWGNRVAAAAFERAGDIWLVFTRPQPIDTALLRTLMPKSIINIEQFYSDTHTILRLTTDGTLHVTARQPSGSYRWHILLSPRRVPPLIDTTVTGQSEDDDKTTYLLFNLFGSGTPVTFYDPRIGDKVIVVPTYEEGHGLTETRNFPGMEAIASQQGLAITSLRDDLNYEYTRAGFKVTGSASLSVSRNLPTVTAKAEPVHGASGGAEVLIPYDKWYIAPGDYMKVRSERLRNIANATPAARPDTMLSLVQLAMGQGYLVEAIGHLNLIRAQYPEYYKANQLALLRAACDLLLNRLADAHEDIAAPEIEATDEMQLWRDAIGLFTPEIAANPAPAPATPTAPAPDAVDVAAQKGTLSNAGGDIENAAPPLPVISAAAKEFDFVGYNQSYIRFYPPVIRQRLAMLAAEYYLKSAEPEKAIAVYDTLNHDNILKPIQLYAEFALGKTAAKKSQNKQAVEILDRLAQQHGDRYIQSQARYEDAILKYRNGLMTPAQAEEELERVRMGWRGDALEHKVLTDLANIYRENKQYDNTLRIWKYLLTSFPGDPDTLEIAGDMSELFQQLFLGGEADAMEPLKSLALFYEFRELTPLGDKGNEIIQKLADRLAAVDLLDRAAALLEHQIKYRASGEARARIGARMALICLLNQEPARALEALQTTNYGAAPKELQLERQQLTAQALSRLGKNEDALVMLYNDTSREGGLLRLDILWAMKDWPNIVNQAEDILSERPNLTEPLTPEETTVLLKLALAYNFEGDYTQLGYLRDYYIALVPESPTKQIFAFLTNDTAPIDTADFDMVARQISHTEGFLDTFKKKIAAGKLSETDMPPAKKKG